MREKYNGILVINKDSGYTSFDVIAKLRGILGQRKMGHTGTLDPDATGVLPIGLGNATKLNDMLIDKRKIYRTVMVLGLSTDTQDISGTVLKDVKTSLCEDTESACSDSASAEERRLTKEQIALAVKSFEGGYEQLPPMYSAIRVNGKRLYELARQGVEIERTGRWVEILSIEISDIAEVSGHIEVSMLVECSKGTYIRTLANDIGDKLGVGGCVKLLERTLVGQFELSKSYTLPEVQALMDEGRILEAIVPTDKCLEGYGEGHLKEEADRLLLSGNMVTTNDFVSLSNERSKKGILMYDSHGEFMATYVYSKRFKSYKPEKMFL